jgi:hypothetical protein
LVVREVVVPYLDVLLVFLPKSKNDDFVEVSKTLLFGVVTKAESALFVLDLGVVVVVDFFFSKKRLIASITS